MKLELYHLSPYLPYGLEFKCTDVDSGEFDTLQIQEINMTGEQIEIGATVYDFSDLGGEECKPILRPMKDLFTDNLLKLFAIEVMGLGITRFDLDNIKIEGKAKHQTAKICVPYRHEYKEWRVETVYKEICFMTKLNHYQFFLSYHFDIFGLIDEGLAIDFNKVTHQ